jgi:hypothetical protein
MHETTSLAACYFTHMSAAAFNSKYEDVAPGS